MLFNDDQSQKAIFETGSFTGYRPLLELGSGYLSATDDFKQPLCGNEEGWGPMSPFRYDFTPCFIDVWVASVAVLLGIVCGLLAVVWLLRRKQPTEISKDWHFWTKQVSIYHGLLMGLPLPYAINPSQLNTSPSYIR